MFDVTDVYEGDFVEVRLTTTETVLGVVVKLGGDYLVLKEYVDFTYSGYKFIVSSYIVKVSREEPADILAKIVLAEGMNSIADEFRFLAKLEEMDQLLKEIYENRLVCIYHEDSETLSVGRLAEVTDKDLCIECIDRNFEIDQKPFSVPKEAVSMVELGSEYLRIYRDYAEEAPE